MTGHNEFPTEVINAQQISLGDGGNVDQQVLVEFNMDRVWQFRQGGTGASTKLQLLDIGNNKAFQIGSTADSVASNIEINTGSPTGTAAQMKLTNAKPDDQAFAIDIDRDANDAANSYAMRIVSDNAGAGKPGGIDMSAFSAAEPLLKVPAAAITSAGTLSHQIAIDIGGTIFYLYAYTAGS